MRVVVAQKGAREHFLAARALHQQGRLVNLVVDWYGQGRMAGQLTGWLGKAARSAAASRSDALPNNLVLPLRLLGLLSKWTERLAASRGVLYAGYDRTDAAFARAVARQNLPAHEVFFGYSYASLEALESEKQRGVLTIVDQIDPGPVEHRLVAEEMARFPELAGPPEPFPSAHYERAQREWELADAIIVNSEWSRDAIITEGAVPAKIEVLPLAYELDQRPEVSGQRSVVSGPLKVLWLGQVNVRKGIGYLLEAARILEGEPVEFVVVGHLQIRKEVVANAPKNMRWFGPVPRSEAAELYAQSDVFVLPTLSDGFAITQVEALAHGLPVVVTPNCGRVVEDGVTGFVIPPRESQALATALLKFIRCRELAREMAPCCIKAATSFSIDDYGAKLMDIIGKHMSIARSPLSVVR